MSNTESVVDAITDDEPVATAATICCWFAEGKRAQANYLYHGEYDTCCHDRKGTIDFSLEIPLQLRRPSTKL